MSTGKGGIADESLERHWSRILQIIRRRELTKSKLSKVKTYNDHPTDGVGGTWEEYGLPVLGKAPAMSIGAAECCDGY